MPSGTSLVIRSNVVDGRPYNTYRKELRWDFYYSCAYCSITEAEASAIRFVIDHYEPRSLRPDLTNVYANLMYCCDECNSRKGDRSPPAAARAEGLRFFRADTDIMSDHYVREKYLVKGISPTGEYTIIALDLNRRSLQRLRELRARLAICDGFVMSGIAELKKLSIDQLPAGIRLAARDRIKRAHELAGVLPRAIDDVLRQLAKSPLDDDDPDKHLRDMERHRREDEWKGLYPGDWRHRRDRSAANTTTRRGAVPK